MTVPAAIVQGAQACKGVLRHRITKAVLAAVIVYLTVSSISFSQVKQSFLDTDASYFAPFIVVSVATQIFGALSLKLQTDVVVRIPYLQMLRYQLISTSLGTFTPAQMGEFNLVYSLKKQGVNVPTGLSIYLSNKLTSIVLSAALALVGLCLYFMYDAKYLVLISAGGLLLLGVLFLNRRVSAFLRDHVVKRYLNSYYDSFRYLSDLAKQHQLTCLLSLCCLVIRLLLQALGVYLLFLAAHVGNIHFLDVVILFSMARFSSLIPFVLDVGILEVSAIYLFSKVGVGASATFNCYMTSRIINYAICALILALFYRVARTGKGNPEYVQEEDCSNHGT